MYNYFMLIGVVCKDIEIKEIEDGKRVVNIVLAVQRPFAQIDGTYATDFFNISVWEFLADYAQSTIKVGSKICVKGRLVPKLITLDTQARIYKYDLIGEKIFNLSSNQNIVEPLLISLYFSLSLCHS